MTEKICTKCRLQKPLADFVKDSTITSGYAATCLQCNKISCRARYQRNKVMANESSAAYYEANKSSIKAYQKEYREKRRERLAEQKREYYLANKVRLGEAMAEYAQANKEQRKAYLRAYSQDPDKSARRAQLRQMRFKLLRTRVIKSLGGKCYCCGLDDIRFLTIEHLNNDGNQDRWPSGRRVTGLRMLKKIIERGFPEGVTVACYNCNCARQYAGKGELCPHKIPA